MKGPKIAIIGASGAVGEELLILLDEFDFPVGELVLFGSARSAGEEREFRGRAYPILELGEGSFAGAGIDLAFFSAGGAVSAIFAPLAAAAGAVVIDNTSHFRMDPDVPLVVPECNPDAIASWEQRGIIANPNCSTIQMVQVLGPLDEAYGLERVDVSTYQAASGAGRRGMDELVEGLQSFFAFRLDDFAAQIFPHTLALNLIPQIDAFTESGYTKEELKMIHETQKILGKKIKISATCVRVPVLRSHSEALSLKFQREVDATEARDILRAAPNISVLDEPAKSIYPTPLAAANTNSTYVGRIRSDLADKSILHLWCVADQLRVGAAANAIKIAQKWLELRGG